MQRKVIYSSMVLVTLLLVNNIPAGQGEEQQNRRIRHERSTVREHSTNAYNVNANWSCGVPKPKLVYWEEAISAIPVIAPYHKVQMKATVLNRCDRTTGYCAAEAATAFERECVPSRTENVTVSFEGEHMGRRGQNHFYNLTFVNHVECRCQVLVDSSSTEHT